jgi:hypothetical protein
MAAASARSSTRVCRKRRLAALSFLLALIGTGSTTEDEVDHVVDFHLQHPAFWSRKKHDRWARGSRVVAKVVGALWGAFLPSIISSELHLGHRQRIPSWSILRW